MALWLMKCEPDCYSYADLERDGQTAWDGVANPLALKYLRACQPGDLAFFYHTGDEKAVVGVMEITGPAVPDPNETDPKLVVVPVRAVRRLANPVTLATIKADKVFAGWELVTQPRLSVMPLSQALWDRIEGYANGTILAGRNPIETGTKKAAATKKKRAG
jgi:predicted RNA-binding protein with PUA-like domain